VRSALDLLEDAARLRLEARWNEHLRRARGVWTFAHSLEIDGNPSASSRPFAISPSTHDCVQKTDTKSSPIPRSFHVRVARCPRRVASWRPHVRSCEGTRLACAHGRGGQLTRRPRASLGGFVVVAPYPAP
jgi:hypothetical protein